MNTNEHSPPAEQSSHQANAQQDEEFKISKVYDISISKNKAESKKSVVFENTLPEAAHF